MQPISAANFDLADDIEAENEAIAAGGSAFVQYELSKLQQIVTPHLANAFPEVPYIGPGFESTRRGLDKYGNTVLKLEFWEEEANDFEEGNFHQTLDQFTRSLKIVMQSNYDLTDLGSDINSGLKSTAYERGIANLMVTPQMYSSTLAAESKGLAVLGKATLAVSGALNIISAYNHSMDAVNDLKKGDYGRAAFNGLKAVCDVGLLFLRANPYGICVSLAYAVYDAYTTEDGE